MIALNISKAFHGIGIGDTNSPVMQSLEVSLQSPVNYLSGMSLKVVVNDQVSEAYQGSHKSQSSVLPSFYIEMPKNTRRSLVFFLLIVPTIQGSRATQGRGLLNEIIMEGEIKVF